MSLNYPLLDSLIGFTLIADQRAYVAAVLVISLMLKFRQNKKSPYIELTKICFSVLLLSHSTSAFVTNADAVVTSDSSTSPSFQKRR